MPPLQAVDLGLLISQELLKFVLGRLRQLVQLRALQHLLQHRRHVGSGGRRRNEGARRSAEARSLSPAVSSLACSLPRACPPETPAAGPWETESCVRRSTGRAAAPSVRTQPPEARHAGNASSQWASDPAFAFTYFQTQRLQGKCSISLPRFGELSPAPPVPLPSFSPPPALLVRLWRVSARWRYRRTQPPSSFPEVQGDLTVKTPGCHGYSSVAASRNRGTRGSRQGRSTGSGLPPRSLGCPRGGGVQATLALG